MAKDIELLPREAYKAVRGWFDDETCLGKQIATDSPYPLTNEALIAGFVQRACQNALEQRTQESRANRATRRAIDGSIRKQELRDEIKGL